MDLQAMSLLSPTATAFDLTDDAGKAFAPGQPAGVAFSSVLSRFGQGMNDLDPESKARVVAEEFVAGALIFPILKELRASNNAWGPFAPGKHEEMFASLLDGEIASRIVRASNFPLVDRLARDLLRAESRRSAQVETQPAGNIDREA